jgi:hypothetical protein
MTGKSATPARLVYDPAGERLTGRAGGIAVDMRACSGGRRGAFDAGRWLDTPDSWDQRRVGGPLPPGRYTVVWLGEYVGWSGRPFGRACFLAPDPETRAAIVASGRVWHDFLLHGPGPGGSEGCLVPWPAAAYRQLIGLLAGRLDEPVGSLEVSRITAPRAATAQRARSAGS